MNIAIIGYGQMGRKIEELSVKKNITITARIDPNNKDAEYHNIDKNTVRNADVCIDFSHPDSVVNNIREMALIGKNIVVGTTGWNKDLETVEKIVKEYGIGLIYASNFSLGMNLYYKIIENVSSIMNNFIEYDVSGIEMHHNKKYDSPSGTAKILSNIILRNMERKKRSLFGSPLGKINPVEFQFSSVRCGAIPGIHKILFDSPNDTIEISHSVRSRDCFAEGALISAEWVKDKKGFYSFEYLIDSIINNKREY